MAWITMSKMTRTDKESYETKRDRLPVYRTCRQTRQPRYLIYRELASNISVCLGGNNRRSLPCVICPSEHKICISVSAGGKSPLAVIY